MVWKEIHQQTSSHVSQTTNYTSFAEQARRVGYMGTESGRTSHEQLRDHHHHEPHLHPQTCPHPCRLAPPHSHDMHEAMQREMEKARIREEIIMAEIVRRRALEAEVRRELTMELALQRGSDGFLFGSSSVVGFDSPMGILGTRTQGSSLEERIAFSLMERERLNGGHGSGRFDSLPFQRRSPDLRISEVKPVSEGGKEDERIMLLAKPDENISGSKRKALTPPSGVDASEFPSDGILRKKAREEWSCALCEVSATSEQGLNEHLQGKKHKSKEAALTAQRAGKNYSIGFLAKKSTKSIQVRETVDPVTEDRMKLSFESLLYEKTGEASSKTDDLPLLQENLNSHNLKKNQLVVVQKPQKNDDPKKKNCRFWCEMCQVGTSTEKVMNAHKKGKKHIGRLERSNQNGGASSSNQDKKTVKLINNGVAQDGKGIASDGVDKALEEEARSKDHEAVVPVNPDGHEPVVVVQKVQKNNGPKKKKYKFWCEMCQAGTVSEKVMNAHKKGKKHVSRLKRSNQNGAASSSSQEEKTVIILNLGVAQDGEEIASEDNKVLEEARSEDHEAMGPGKPDDHKPVDETKVEDCGALDTTKPGVGDEPKDDNPTVSRV